MKKILCLTLLYIAMPSLVFATNLYVRADGDSGDPNCSGDHGAPYNDSSPCCAGSFDPNDADSSSYWDGATGDDHQISHGDTVYFCGTASGGNYTANYRISGSIPGSGDEPQNEEDRITFAPAPGHTDVTFAPNASQAGVAFHATGTNYLTLDCDAGGGQISFIPNPQAADQVLINAGGAYAFTIDGCDIDGSTATDQDNHVAIWAGHTGGDYLTATNNTITDVSLGIQFNAGDSGSTHHATISGNTITNMNMESTNGCSGCDGIGVYGINAGSPPATRELYSDASGVTLEYNTISQAADDCIDMISVWGVTVRYNECGPINDPSFPVSTGIKMGVNTLSFSGRDTVYGNYVHDINTSNDLGISTNGSGGSKVYCNLVENIEGIGIYINNEIDNTYDSFVYNNNIICDGTNQEYGIATDNNEVADVYVKNNIVDGNCLESSISIGASNTSDTFGGYNLILTDTSAKNAECIGTDNPYPCCESGTGNGHCGFSDKSGNYTGTANDIDATDPNLNSDGFQTAQSPGIDKGTYISGYDCLLYGDISDWVNTVKVLTTGNSGDGLPDIGLPFPKFGGD